MQKFRVKQTVLAVVLKEKAVYNSFKSPENVFNLSFTCNFTFNITERFSTLLLVIIRLFIKNGSNG